MANGLYLVIIFILFLCLSLAWYQLMAMTPEESIVFSAIFIMIGVFFLGIAGKASLIYAVMITFSVIGIVAFMFDFSLIKNKKSSSMGKRVRCFLSPCIVILCIVFIYTMVAFDGALFTYPDEILEWGPAVRYIFDTGHLYYEPDFTGESITLSVASMFQYIWAGIGAFYEENCFIGNFLLAFIPVFLPFSGLGWKSWKRMSLYAGMLFLSLNVLTYVKYYNLLQDFVLPLWAGSVLAWMLGEKSKEMNLWIYFGALICIGAMKNMVGPLFVGIILIMYFVNDFILQQRNNVILIFHKKNILMFVLSIVSGYIITFVWSLLLKQNALYRVNPSGQEQKSINDIISSMIGKIFNISSNTEKSFPNISYFIMFTILLVLIYYLLKKDTECKAQRTYMIALLLYAVGFVVFFLIMLYAYIKVFSISDSKIAAGLERYLAYYMLLGIPTILGLVVKEKLYLVDKRKSNVVIIGMFLVLMFATGNGFVEKVSTVSIKDDSTYKLRLEIKNISKDIQELTDNDGKIFLLGEIDAMASKCLTYELGKQYIWNEDCYKMSLRESEDANVYRDGVKYPFLLQDFNYVYVWCYNVSEENEYDKLKYYYELQDIKVGNFYKLNFDDEKVEAVLLGNIKESEQ